MRLLYSHFVPRKILLVVMGCAALLGCGRQAGAYAPPPQQSLALGFDPGKVGTFVAMDDPLADQYIVRDISSQRGYRRWAFLHPEMRFQVQDASHLKFAAEFALPEVTFHVTGPVTFSCAVNGQPLGSMRCDRAGDWRFEKTVPPGIVEPDKEIRVTFQVSPGWVSPEDGAELSFFLRSAGFTQ